jgi:single-strand DNA-binding protein
MASSLNRIQIVGNLGRDPEMKYLANGDPVTNFTVAVNHSYKPKGSDEWKEETEWFDVSLFGPAAERATAELAKGSKLYVEGQMRSRSWQTDDGGRQTRWSIRCDRYVPFTKANGEAKAAPRKDDGWPEFE